MGTRYVNGGEIVARTTEGNLVQGQQVTVEDDAYAGKAALTLVTGGIGALAFAAGPDRTNYVRTDDGQLHEVKETIRRK